MEKSLLDKKLGAETDLDIVFKDAKLQFVAKYAGRGADASVAVAVKPDYFLDKLKAIIPGQVDDGIIDMLKLAFKIA